MLAIHEEVTSHFVQHAQRVNYIDSGNEVLNRNKNIYEIHEFTKITKNEKSRKK